MKIFNAPCGCVFFDDANGEDFPGSFNGCTDTVVVKIVYDAPELRIVSVCYPLQVWGRNAKKALPL